MNDLLYAIKFRDKSPDSELVFEFLAALDVQYSSYEDKEFGNSYLLIYTESEEEFAAVKARFLAGLAEWREYGLSVTDVEEITVRKEDWSEVWKKYFNIIHIADNLVIRPSWLKYNPAPGEAVVTLDPGMSFGTGQHATTSFCLRTLAEYAKNPDVKSVLDAGCGSGILAIAAALLGYSPVDAFDYDPEAIMVAGENIAANGLSGADIKLEQADVAEYTGREGGYDLALVNILGHILKANAEHIVGFVRPGGLLALAGILNEEFDELSKRFTAIPGCVELKRFSEKEWTSGLFRCN